MVNSHSLTERVGGRAGAWREFNDRTVFFLNESLILTVLSCGFALSKWLLYYIKVLIVCWRKVRFSASAITWSGCWQTVVKCLVGSWDCSAPLNLGFILLIVNGPSRIDTDGEEAGDEHQTLARVTHFNKGCADFHFSCGHQTRIVSCFTCWPFIVFEAYERGTDHPWIPARMFLWQIAIRLQLWLQISQRSVPSYRTSFWKREGELESVKVWKNPFASPGMFDLSRTLHFIPTSIPSITCFRDSQGVTWWFVCTRYIAGTP